MREQENTILLLKDKRMGKSWSKAVIYSIKQPSMNLINHRKLFIERIIRLLFSSI